MQKGLFEAHHTSEVVEQTNLPLPLGIDEVAASSVHDLHLEQSAEIQCHCDS